MDIMNNHRCVPAISGNYLLEESVPKFSATDKDNDLISLQDHHFRPPDVDNYYCFQNYNNYYDVDVERSSNAALSYWEDEKARLDGTLESIVDQAATLVVGEAPSTITSYYDHGDDLMDTLFDDSNPTIMIQPPLNITSVVAVDDITSTTTMAGNDAVVPSSTNQQQQPTWCNVRACNDDDYMSLHVPDNTGEIEHGIIGRSINNEEEEENEEYCYYTANLNGVVDMDNFVGGQSEPSTFEEEWMRTAVNDYEDDPTSSVSLSLTNTTNNSIVVPDHFPPYRNKREGKGKAEKRSTSTTTSSNKKSMSTILHNKAERKRRKKISQKMEALQRLVPNICYKTDKATMLDQVIEYIKKLQTEQNNAMMMRNEMINSMPCPMMIPIPYYMKMQQHQQQQLQIPMMDTRMSMGPSLGSTKTISIMHPNMSIGTKTPTIVHPTSLIPSSSCDF